MTTPPKVFNVSKHLQPETPKPPTIVTDWTPGRMLMLTALFEFLE
jgi:hypothetical protein